MGTYGRYFIAAMTAQLNIVLMAAAAVFSLVAWTPVPLVAGLLGEAAWLGVAPLLPSFRRSADRRAEKHKKIDLKADEKRLLDSIPPDMRERFRKISGHADRIKAGIERASGPAKALLERSSGRLDDAVRRAALLLKSAAEHEELLYKNPVPEIQARISAVDAEAGSDDERLREIRLQQKGILERRLDKLRAAERNLQLLHAQIDSLEDALKLFEEQAVSLEDPGAATEQLDALLADIDVTGAAVDDLRDSLAGFDRALADSAETAKLPDKGKS